MVLDNLSTAPDLLDYYASSAFAEMARLISLGKNIGPRPALFHAMRNFIGPNAPFIFTDPDLLLPAQPDEDMIGRMLLLGRQYGVLKVGLALDISEPGLFRPMTLERRGKTFSMDQWERRFWSRRAEADVYHARVDTTFFVHVPPNPGDTTLMQMGLKQGRVPALRIAGPGFLAKHRPWYLDDGMTDAERRYYRQSASNVASWIRSNADAGGAPA